MGSSIGTGEACGKVADGELVVGNQPIANKCNRAGRNCGRTVIGFCNASGDRQRQRRLQTVSETIAAWQHRQRCTSQCLLLSYAICTEIMQKPAGYIRGVTAERIGVATPDRPA